MKLIVQEGKIQMIQQHEMTRHCLNGGIFDFMEYKKRKPFFPKPLKITLGHPINETFEMITNVVYNDKQILALIKEDEPETVVLVEAVIEDGQLIQVCMLEDEQIEGVAHLLA